ncbi:MAG: phosphoribosylanthranilate isomerase [Bacteroides sp.]|nr:phosphoribosylanthranilate isomerase [Bacteroides sp.]
MINGKLIKVCGMREEKNIREIEQLGIDMMGFIFYPKSPRYLLDIPAYLPEKVSRVGVFVNEEEVTVETLSERFSLDYIQLHGTESPEYCQQLQSKGKQIIKAFSVLEKEDLNLTQPYESSSDYFLFDTKCEQYGGSGKSFNWEILEAYNGKTPFLLSGGIGPGMANALKAFHHPMCAGFDLNSKFETAPGKKDVNQLKEFIHQLM